MVAYLDTDSTGFGRLPWILDCVDNEDVLLDIVKNLVQRGFQRVTAFIFNENDFEYDDEITWEYVNQHKYNIK